MKLQFAPWVKYVIGSVSRGSILVAILLAIVGALVSNRVLFAFQWFLDHVDLLTPWTIVGVLTAVCILLFIGVIKVVPGNLSSEAIRDRKIVKMGESQIKVLACCDQTHSQEEHDTQTRAVLKGTLTDVIHYVGNNSGRAAILLPDPKDSDFILCYEEVEMSHASTKAMRYYIGSDTKRQEKEGGVAGQSFVEGEILVGHMNEADSYQTCRDQKRYIEHPGAHPYNPYKSFACVPIKGLTPGHTTRSTLGVLCIDSLKEDMFDAKDTTPMLDMIATSLAASILICEKFRVVTSTEDNTVSKNTTSSEHSDTNHLPQ